MCEHRHAGRGARAPRARDGATASRVTPRGAPAAAITPTPPPTSAAARPEQLLHRVLGRDGVDRQPGSQLEARDLAQPRVDLPVPVVRRVDLLAQRRGVEDEVVGRSVEARRPAGRGPGGAPRRWPGGRHRSPGRSPPRGGAGRPTPRTASATPTGRRRRCRRPPTGGGRGRATSSRTRRHHGHSPSRITKRAAPPSSSATRCGIWGRSYRSRHRWFVRAPACAPQFWTTWT